MLDREPADIKSNGMSLVELCSEGHVRVASHQLLQSSAACCELPYEEGGLL